MSQGDKGTHIVKNQRWPSTCLIASAIHEPVDFSKMGAGVSPVTYLMVNGIAGKLGHAVAEAATRVAGLQLIPESICSRRRDQLLQIGGVAVQINHPLDRDLVLDRVAKDFPGVIVADCTLPVAVNVNAEAYCTRQLPFVMGTTGGDTVKLLQTVKDAGSYAVIAPNMGKPIVALQAVLEIMASQFPGAFAGYTLEVTESHQSTKVDTSGTAKEIVASFNKLGIDFDRAQIKKIRECAEQIKWGVPEEHLNGHAFHTYTVTSAKDQSFTLQFHHNVCGKKIYAEGTLDAVLFLAKKIREKAEKKIYNLVDVLREGNMR